MWSGQRPLVRKGGAGSTAALSRDHTILISETKLVTVTGGKWTTYRKMAQDAVDHAAPLGGLEQVPSRTPELRLHGWTNEMTADREWETCYGADLPALRRLEEENPEWSRLLHPGLPFKRGEVIWAARNEMARTVEDVLARRTRALFLDARASIEAASETADLLAQELGKSNEWVQQQTLAFRQTAEGYLWPAARGTEM